jgi:hypothetical protein
MVWAITIASFLGIVVVALLIFFIYSQKEQIRKALNEKRTEKRIPTEVEVELSAAHEPLIYEKSPTENTSRHGARIFTGKSWRPHDHVLVRLPFGNETSNARVAYCDVLPEGAFAVGLYFPSAVDDWLTSDSDISDDEGSSQLYRK